MKDFENYKFSIRTIDIKSIEIQKELKGSQTNFAPQQQNSSIAKNSSSNIQQKKI